MAFVILIILIGFSIASFISMTNIYIARGVLGGAFIILLYREFETMFKSFNDAPLDILYSFPYYVRYFLTTLGVSLLFYLGLHEVIQLVLFIIRNFISK